jgi:hypothetical protein
MLPLLFSTIIIIYLIGGNRFGEEKESWSADWAGVRNAFKRGLGNGKHGEERGEGGQGEKLSKLK